MTSFLSRLAWRNATKKFDPSNKVPQDVIAKVLEAVRFAPSSFGLQPYYVKVVTDPAMKTKLQEAGWGQAQFLTSTAVFVYVARTDVVARVEQMLGAMSGGQTSARAALADFEKMLLGFAEGLTPEQALIWAQKQCYIALGFGLAACAELGIASCPMEGFNREEFDRILGLPKGHHATVVMTLGHADPEFKPFPKFRFSESDLFRFV